MEGLYSTEESLIYNLLESTIALNSDYEEIFDKEILNKEEKEELIVDIASCYEVENFVNEITNIIKTDLNKLLIKKGYKQNEDEVWIKND